MVIVQRPKPAIRRLLVRHQTRYQYDKPIQRSAHRIHLRPLHSDRQVLHHHRLEIIPDVPIITCEDVFGNHTVRFEITQPYQELTVTALSEVELLDTDPFDFAKTPDRPPFPLAWMPWERKVLAPYLEPDELPETQVKELYDYARSYLKRNNHDLLETLFDINLTLFREYQYVPGSTGVETSPYTVFSSKKGVCQDFANLFIYLARLVEVPARYVCGYVYTGNTGSCRAGSDASHAWLELYLPNIGWREFDPTNGVLPRSDHVRVARGRHFRDTAPMSGTLFTPAIETMGIDVEVSDADEQAEPPVNGETAPVAAAPA
jgi:transglutaminase-like putative cysteine protease